MNQTQQASQSEPFKKASNSSATEGSAELTHPIAQRVGVEPEQHRRREPKEYVLVLVLVLVYMRHAGLTLNALLLRTLWEKRVTLPLEYREPRA